MTVAVHLAGSTGIMLPALSTLRYPDRLSGGGGDRSDNSMEDHP